MHQASTVFDAICNGRGGLIQKVRDLLTDYASALVDDAVQCAPQLHPLGFLCLRWNLDQAHSVRVHIWDKSFDWTQSPHWPIHDHTFGFRSVVLRGAIQNKTYKEVSALRAKEWTVFDVDYSADSSLLIPRSNCVRLQVLSSVVQHAGSTYELSPRTLHRSTLRASSAITVLATGAAATQTVQPRVIGCSALGPISYDRRANVQVNVLGIVQRSVDSLGDI